MLSWSHSTKLLIETHTKGNFDRSSFDTGLLGEVTFGSGGRGGVGNFDNAVIVIRTGPSSEAGFAAGS